MKASSVLVKAKQREENEETTRKIKTRQPKTGKVEEALAILVNTFYSEAQAAFSGLWMPMAAGVLYMSSGLLMHCHTYLVNLASHSFAPENLLGAFYSPYNNSYATLNLDYLLKHYFAYIAGDILGSSLN